MKIRKLSAEARSKLQSGIIVTNTVQCVLELVQNSLDAEATGVAVRIDLKNYQIRVVDNGKGIGEDDLEFVGERFMTSKNHDVDLNNSFPTYGYRGQALSSLLEVSKTLTIETKPSSDGPTFVKVFQKNKALPIIKTNLERTGTGTTVTIEDFMYSMPVRRKRINEVFDMEDVKNQLQYLAVIHYNVCFTLRNENKGLILLQIPQASSILESITNIFGKPLAKSLTAVSHQEKQYEISGFISLKPQSQNNVQLLYLNKRIITKGVIHKFINNLTKEYIGKNTLLTESPVGKILNNLKGSFPFILQIKCPHFYYELFSNLQKTTVEFKNWKDVLKCIHRAIKKPFKNTYNLGSSSSSFSKDKKNKKHIEEKKIFGTSLLINAIKGAPAKRALKSKNIVKKCKKIKLEKNRDSESNVFLSRNSESAMCKPLTDNLNTNTKQRACTKDSLESPIPRKNFGDFLRPKTRMNLKNFEDFNQSFYEFYEWLKTTFKTDASAFNLYSNFIQFKNKSNHLTEVKSPVLGRKLKKKHTVNFKKDSDVKEMRSFDGLSAVDQEIALMTQKQLKIFPSCHLRMKKAFQLTNKMNCDFVNNLNLSSIRSETLNFDNHCKKTVLDTPEGACVSGRNLTQIKYNHLSTLPSSEVQVTNVIKFRNLCESSFQQPFNTSYGIPSTLSSTSKTWASHYENSIPKNTSRKEHHIENSIPWMEAMHDSIAIQGNKRPYFDFRYPSESYAGLRKLTKSTKTCVLQDVEIQVNMSELIPPVEKVRVDVETSRVVAESPNSENSYVFYKASAKVTAKENIPQGDFSQEVPNPDFWNTSSHMRIDEVNTNEFAIDANEEIVSNEKESLPKESVCGQDSTKTTGITRETQTLADLWTDDYTENVTGIDSRKSENGELPKTISIEEISHNKKIGSQPPEFRLTERHDFVPKGLSPKFVNPAPRYISTLSSQEKSKIKSAVEKSQNELLARIKWQDEFTGDCLKPTIPDEIFCEMRRKAGESVTNYGNPVLSASLSYSAVKVHNLLHSFTFTKELLSNTEILGQLDKKFIVTKMKVFTPKKMGLISLFDQHAVDERIKLEEIINENISFDGKFISTCLNPPVNCTLTDFQVRVVSDLQEKFFTFGLSVKPVNENTVSVNEIPAFLFYKHNKDLKNKKETSLSLIIEALIVDIIDELLEAGGAAAKIPKNLHNAFCLEACHKAVKFNKALPMSLMTEMISKLQSCKLPFQCAHGRPSVIPIIDFEDCKPTIEENETIALERFKKFITQKKVNENI